MIVELSQSEVNAGEPSQSEYQNPSPENGAGPLEDIAPQKVEEEKATNGPSQQELTLALKKFKMMSGHK